MGCFKRWPFAIVHFYFLCPFCSLITTATSFHTHCPAAEGTPKPPLLSIISILSLGVETLHQQCPNQDKHTELVFNDAVEHLLCTDAHLVKGEFCLWQLLFLLAVPLLFWPLNSYFKRIHKRISRAN